MTRLLTPAALRSEVEALWDRGLPRGDKTGWRSVDEFYSVVPGQLTVITGWPSSGKSEWLDALLINLFFQGWYTAIFSAENRPVSLHLAKMLEKLSGKPFGPGPTERLTREEAGDLTENELNTKFVFLDSQAGQGLSVEEVLESAEQWLTIARKTVSKERMKRALVIDPWNELEHWRPVNLSETEYVSKTLSSVRNWARSNNVHVFLVAHPRNMRRNDGGKLPVPTPDMISGSQHWWNKADCAITVHREQGENPSDEVEIHIQKVRFKHVGKQGLVVLRYDRVTGRYQESAPNIYDVRRK